MALLELTYKCVSMPSRAYTSFLRITKLLSSLSHICVNALSGLYLISTYRHVRTSWCIYQFVSMPSRAYTSFLQGAILLLSGKDFCRVNALSGLYLISTIRARQFCNKRMVHVSMPSRAYTSFLQNYRCCTSWNISCVNALSGLYLISTVPLQKPRFYSVSRACFCRYLSEYSDNSRFSCMLTFWTYLMRFTYPWHWIKYSTKYNRCHPIFSLSW